MIKISPSLFDLNESANISVKDVKDLTEKMLEGFKQKLREDKNGDNDDNKG